VSDHKEENKERSFAIDVVFDTNAVRRLAHLEPGAWNDLLIQSRTEGLICAWIPWVISEVTASNLVRRNLTDEDVAEVVLAARRYDTLCKGLILPSPDRLMWSAIHRFAGMEEPPPPRRDITADHRYWLDKFFCLSSAAQVRVHDGNERTVLIKLHDDDKEWGAPLPTGFVEAAALGTEWLRTRHKEAPELPRRELAWEYFRQWLGHTTASLGVAPEVVKTISETRDPEKLAHTPFMGGLVEGWFIAGRAIGHSSKLSENDARDIAISSYLSGVAILVTNDRSFRSLLKELLLDPRRVIKFDEFMTGPPD
jgi:hypothetical protein